MKFLSLIFCGLFLSTLAMAESKVTLFVTLSPAGSFQAVSSKPKGEVLKKGDAIKADKVSVSIESFKTGIDLRDEHFWKHLNSSKHPKATLTQVNGKGGVAVGILEVNGIKRRVKINYQVKGSDIHGEFSVRASEFKLPKAEYLGVGVQDNIQIKATFPYKSL